MHFSACLRGAGALARSEALGTTLTVAGWGAVRPQPFIGNKKEGFVLFRRTTWEF